MLPWRRCRHLCVLQANSMPAMFWALALLCLPQHDAARARILCELADATQQVKQQQQPDGAGAHGRAGSAAVGVVDADTAAAMVELAMDKRSWVSRCVAEAIRLRLHSIAGAFEWGLWAALCVRCGLQTATDARHPPCWLLPRAATCCHVLPCAARSALCV
jgi:hypothetical protein